MKKCHWEMCTEEATCLARWRRENPPYGDAFDHADYCGAHMYSAEAIGAVKVCDLTPAANPVAAE